MKKSYLLLSGILAAGLASLATGAEVAVTVAEKTAPPEIEPALRDVLQKKAVQIGSGDKTAYEFWLCSEVPLQSKPASAAKGLDSLKQATLLGVVNVPSDQRDYRDDELHAGVYTMRFALQPQDGNHLGTSEFSYFAVLTPAKLDPKPDGIADYKALVKASGKETATGHPVILSLRPASSDGGDAPKLNAPAPEHKSVRVKVPARIGEEKTSLTFEIVYEGKGHK